MARAHAALAAEQAYPGHGAHGLGDEVTFDEVRTSTKYGCLWSLKNHNATASDGIPAELLKHSGGTGVQVLTHLFNANITVGRAYKPTSTCVML